MKIDEVTGLLSDVCYVISPHQDVRPADAVVSMIVIHGISLPPGEFGGQAITDFFMGKLVAEQHPYFLEIIQLRVSAHLLINRAGIVTQFVPFTARAWHAGVSIFAGQENCNDFSIGIELEGTDNIPYTLDQYQTLVKVIALLQEKYPAITMDRIVGHSDVAPGRKTDPGPIFDWGYLRSKLKDY